MLGASVVIALVGAPAAVNAQDVSFKLEPAVAIPLSAPQSQLYNVGGGESVSLLLSYAPWLDVGPTTSFMVLPSSATGGESGIAWGFGPSVRIHRPHAAASLGHVSPWLDLDGLYIRTGERNRLGYATAIGFTVPLDDERRFWAGPFVRYMQTVQPARDGYDNRDAKILLVGLSLEVGSRAHHRHARDLDREPDAVAVTDGAK